MTATVQCVQIERTVIRAGLPNAMFHRLDGFYLCQASLWPEGTEDGRVQIVTRGGMLNAEEAGQVAIALQMALEWIAEEMAATAPATEAGKAQDEAPEGGR